MAVEAREKSEPKYYLVKRHLLDLLPDFGPGVPLPTERDLARALSTSRSTVRQALAELVTEGRLVRRHGSGTYVAEPKLTWPLQLHGFTEWAAATGVDVESSFIAADRVRATDELAQTLGLKSGAMLHRLERVRNINRSPMALEQSYLPASRFPGLPRAVRRTGSLYQALTEIWDIKIVSAVATIETTPASPREAGLLHTDVGAPMLLASRRSVDASNTPVEWVRMWYRGDRYKFVATLGSDGAAPP